MGGIIAATIHKGSSGPTTTAWKYSSIQESYYSSGPAWESPEAAALLDGSFAYLTFSAFSGTQRLYLHGYDFSEIPAGATIIGVEAEIHRYCTGDVADDTVYLTDTSGSGVGDGRQKSGNWPYSLTAQSFGGASDLWGVALTRSIVAASGFGVSLRCAGSSGSAYVDTIRMRITYQ